MMTLYVSPNRRIARRRRSMDHRLESNHHVSEVLDWEKVLAVDVRSDDESYTISALIPGIEADDINVEILNKTVSIRGEFNEKMTWRNNPDCPALSTWTPESLDPGNRRTWQRNSFYYCVDGEGNQLPYIDGLDEKNVGDVEVQKLEVIQGNIDFECFHGFFLEDVSTLKLGEPEGNFETRFWDSGSGTGMPTWCRVARTCHSRSAGLRPIRTFSRSRKGWRPLVTRNCLMQSSPAFGSESRISRRRGLSRSTVPSPRCIPPSVARWMAPAPRFQRIPSAQRRCCSFQR